MRRIKVVMISSKFEEGEIRVHLGKMIGIVVLS